MSGSEPQGNERKKNTNPPNHVRVLPSRQNGRSTPKSPVNSTNTGNSEERHEKTNWYYPVGNYCKFSNSSPAGHPAGNAPAPIRKTWSRPVGAVPRCYTGVGDQAGRALAGTCCGALCVIRIVAQVFICAMLRQVGTDLVTVPMVRKITKATLSLFVV